MRQGISPLLAFGLLGIVCTVAVAADDPALPKAIWIVDDFEHDGLPLWSGPTGPCLATNTGLTGADGSSRSLRIDGACGVFGGVWTDLGGGQPTGITFWVAPGEPFLSDAYVVIGNTDVASNLGAVFFAASSSGELVMATSTASYSLGSYSSGQWYRIDLSLDWVGKHIDVDVDGVPRQRNVPFRSAATASLNRLHFFNYDNSAGWLDQIVMSTPGVSLDIFDDGFESADGTAWSSEQPPMPERLVLYDAGGVAGAIGGRSGADVLCGIAAETTPGVPHHAITRAFISVDADDEIRDMPIRYGVPTDRPITSPGRTIIADDWADLLDGSIDVELDDGGVLTTTNFWYSGSLSDGSVSTATCSGWTSDSTLNAGHYGSSQTTGSGWMTTGGAICGSHLYHVLCLAWR